MARPKVVYTGQSKSRSYAVSMAECIFGAHLEEHSNEKEDQFYFRGTGLLKFRWIEDGKPSEAKCEGLPTITLMSRFVFETLN